MGSRAGVVVVSEAASRDAKGKKTMEPPTHKDKEKLLRGLQRGAEKSIQPLVGYAIEPNRRDDVEDGAS
jgi:hypothetical protein